MNEIRTLKAASGKYHVYQAGRMCYIVTDGEHGPIVKTETNLSEAAAKARWLLNRDKLICAVTDQPNATCGCNHCKGDSM